MCPAAGAPVQTSNNFGVDGDGSFHNGWRLSVGRSRTPLSEHPGDGAQGQPPLLLGPQLVNIHHARQILQIVKPDAPPFQAHESGVRLAVAGFLSEIPDTFGGQARGLDAVKG